MCCVHGDFIYMLPSITNIFYKYHFIYHFDTCKILGFLFYEQQQKQICPSIQKMEARG